MKPNPVVISSPPALLTRVPASQLREEICNAIAAGSQTFLINFQEVKFIDSLGLGVLITIRKDIYRIKGQLYLCSLNEQAKMLLAVTGLNRVFCIFADQAEFQEKVIGND